jgi:hypothetical protein
MRTALQSCFDSFVQEQNATPPTAELHLRRIARDVTGFA